MRYLLVGNYGTGNLGDEALRDYFIEAFPAVSWAVVTAGKPVHHMEVPRLPLGVRSLFRPWWKTLKQLAGSDGMVFGGGTLFTDIESSFACLLWWWHAFAARIFHKPIHLAFQGIGPFKTAKGEWCARWVVRRAASISVRDPVSFERVNNWKMNTKLVQTFDPIISFIEAKKLGDSSKKVLVIIPRMNASVAFLDTVKLHVDNEQWDAIRILSFQPDNSQEADLCGRLTSLCGHQATVIPIRTLDALVAALSGAELILTQRYHGAVAALALGIQYETIPQEDEDKLASLVSRQNPEELHALVRSGENALKEALST